MTCGEAAIQAAVPEYEGGEVWEALPRHRLQPACINMTDEKMVLATVVYAKGNDWQDKVGRAQSVHGGECTHGRLMHAQMLMHGT